MREILDVERIIRPNLVDRAVNFFAPAWGVQRLRARAMMAGGYIGGSRVRRALKAWRTYGQDADADILPDLPILRERSRDLIRNNPLAAGQLRTKITNVVGAGSKLQSRIDRAVLGMDDAAADDWEAKTEREWRLFWDSANCDISRTQNGNALTKLVYRQAKENGDVFVLLSRVQADYCPYSLRLQIIEADRVCNEDNVADTDTLAGGIELDVRGAPKRYHILRAHPGAIGRYKDGVKWDKIDAFGPMLGLRNVLHLFDRARPGQSRGVPDLAPVIEAFKQLGNYTEAELAAAVISGMFTVFIETPGGDATFDMPREGKSLTKEEELKLAAGAIIGLKPGEKIHDTNPGRPNIAFDAFVAAILRQVGVALEVPYEILVKNFTASYSASRAVFLEFWKYIQSERAWLVDNFCQVVYEIWMHEAVALGRIAAPGFFGDPIIRKAYFGAQWIFPAKGAIDELKEVKAAQLRISEGISTLAEVVAEMTGGDFEKKHSARVKEHNMRRAAGFVAGLPEGEEDDE